MKSFLLSVVIALLPVLMLQAEEKRSDTKPEKKPAPKVEESLKIGTQAPDFQIKDANGKLIKLSDLTKKTTKKRCAQQHLGVFETVRSC